MNPTPLDAMPTTPYTAATPRTHVMDGPNFLFVILPTELDHLRQFINRFNLEIDEHVGVLSDCTQSCLKLTPSIRYLDPTHTWATSSPIHPHRPRGGAHPNELLVTT